MLFNIEVDQGDLVSGYLVPDSFSESTSLLISEDGQELATLPCVEERAALVLAGRHATGRCGFTINQSAIPDLPKRLRLELRDTETGVLVYRRRAPSEVVQKRVFRLETQLLPLWRLDDSVDKFFQFFHKGIERHGQETSTQVFVLNNARSLYLSGSLVFRAYEYYLDETFTCIVMLRNPYKELAERLLLLKHGQDMHHAQLFGARELMRLAPAIDFAKQIELDEKLLRRLFSSMPKAAIARFGNPVTRLLAARNADEVPIKGAVAGALRALSSFTIVGLREYQELFLSQLADLIGTDAQALPVSAELEKAVALSEILRHVPEAEVLIEQDLEIYNHVKGAVEASTFS